MKESHEWVRGKTTNPMACAICGEPKENHTDRKEYTPDSKGLYAKYVVFHRNENTIYCVRNSLDDCFVLRLPDPHARKALQTYFTSISKENPMLAVELAIKLLEYEAQLK